MFGHKWWHFVVALARPLRAEIAPDFQGQRKAFSGGNHGRLCALILLGHHAKKIHTSCERYAHENRWRGGRNFVLQAQFLQFRQVCVTGSQLNLFGAVSRRSNCISDASSLSSSSTPPGHRLIV